MNTQLKTPDEIRHEMTAQFEHFTPHIQAFHDYSTRVAALGLEYHFARLKELRPVEIEELVEIAMFDARETPKSLDTKLEQLLGSGVVVKRIFFDRTKGVFHIFA